MDCEYHDSVNSFEQFQAAIVEESSLHSNHTPGAQEPEHHGDTPFFHPALDAWLDKHKQGLLSSHDVGAEGEVHREWQVDGLLQHESGHRCESEIWPDIDFDYDMHASFSSLGCDVSLPYDLSQPPTNPVIPSALYGLVPMPILLTPLPAPDTSIAGVAPIDTTLATCSASMAPTLVSDHGMSLPPLPKKPALRCLTCSRSFVSNSRLS